MELFHGTNPVTLGVSYSGGDALAFVDSVHSSFDSVLQFKTGGSERFRIGALDADTFQIKPAAAANDVEITDNSGAIILYSDTGERHVGIGAKPSAKLHVSGSDATDSSIRQSRAGVKIWDQAIDSSGRLQWGYRTTEGGTRTTTFTLDDNNSVGIGNASPSSARLVIREDSNYGIRLEDGSGHYFRVNTGGNTEIRGSVTASQFTAAGNISASGNFVANQITSSGGATFNGNVGIAGPAGSKTLEVTGTMKSSGEAFWSHFDNLSSNSRFRDDLALFFGVNRQLGWKYNSTLDKLVLTSGSSNHTLTFDGNGNISGSGNITAGSVLVDSKIIHNGDSDTSIDFSGDQVIFTVGNETLLTLTESSQDIVTIGDGGDVDFKVRSLNNDNAIFVQGSTDKVGIGTSGPSAQLQVHGASDNYEIFRIKGDTPEHGTMKIYSGSYNTAALGYHHQGYFFNSAQSSNPNGAFFIRADKGIDFGLNNTGSLSIQSQSANVIIDSKVKVGIGTNSPSDPLHVAGNIRWTGNATNAGNGNIVMGTGQLKFADSGKLMIGDSNDLQIYHDGSNSQIADTGAGSLDISSNHIHLRSAVDGGDNLAQFFAGGHSYIYGNNVVRMEATAYGVNLVGPVTASGNISSSATITANAFVGDGSGLTGISATISDLTVDNATLLLNFQLLMEQLEQEH